MGKYMERCRQLREDTTRHYGCSQAVFLPVAEAMGMDSETAFRLSSHFRAGMLQGEVCGAVNGALMALGLAGADSKTATELLNRVRANHQGRPGLQDPAGPLGRPGRRQPQAPLRRDVL
ncbi:MAG: C-GCAxxG-C-C family protein [Clostridiales bacterium]|nr:C-GCAxxG-C-C family protein [Clostridiales bacterium]